MAAGCGGVSTAGPSGNGATDAAADVGRSTVPDAAGEVGPSSTSDAAVETGQPSGADVQAGARAPMVVASKQDGPARLALDPANVYWTNVGGASGATTGPLVVGCAKTGCPADLPAIWTGPYTAVGDLAVAGPLYWSEIGVGSNPSAPQILRCEPGGCGGAPVSIVTAAGAVESLVADATNLFWATANGDVNTCAAGACAGSAAIVVSGGDAGGPHSVAIDAKNVYWTAGDTGQVLMCPRAGCLGAPTVLASGQTRPGAIAVDAANIYWIVTGDMGGGNVPAHPASGQVMQCAITGCGGTPTLLASYASWFGAGAIVADGAAVYWTTALGTAAGGQVVKCATAGCGKAPTVIASTDTGGSPSVGLAVDDHDVYWTDRGLGEVLKTAK